MSKLKFYLIIIICFLAEAKAQVIHIKTATTSLVYSVYGSKIKQFHFGNSLSSIDGITKFAAWYKAYYGIK